MPNTEKKDYQTLRNNVPEPADRMDRIENIIVVGMPDINACFDGVEFWIELKSPKEPKRSTTPLFGSNHRLSQDQKNWFLRQRNARGKCYILIATDVHWLLIEGMCADRVNEMTVVGLIAESIWDSLKPIPKEKWKELRKTLIGQTQ
jgi:hypothetical protein